ncbi:MAG: esterase/lipase family protein [Planctomycetota bacterium]
MPSHHPKHPIIYVRGFAATQGEIEQTVADPYMGFNIGSTKSRKAWTGDMRRYYFESPLVRLMSDHDYDDVFVDGADLSGIEPQSLPIPYRSIVIYRYYDEVSNDFGDGQARPMEHFAKGLDHLILRLRERICANPKNGVAPEDFRVYLVAHSMGGLICRAFLQNPKLGSDDARKCVDKVFTYATPHNGIDLRIVRNVPGWLTFGSIDNFNRGRMAQYLALPPGASDVSELQGYPAERVFNLIGTNSSDYGVLGGVSAWAAGPASDGLVRLENATTHTVDSSGRKVASPRAYVHRSHSGHYGIVNSEEGYQNLTRFLFGSLRVDGVLNIDEISLPVEVQRALDDDKSIKASYEFEVAVSVRGCQWQMTRQEVREHSAIFRTFDELFPKRGGQRQLDRSRSPHLFSVFLDPAKSVKSSGSVSFAFDLKVMVPDYEVDGFLFLDRHYEGGFILRKLILVEAIPDKDSPVGWRIRYGLQETNPGKPGVAAEASMLPDNSGLRFSLPLEQRTRPGLKGHLEIAATPWNRVIRNS